MIIIMVIAHHTKKETIMNKLRSPDGAVLHDDSLEALLLGITRGTWRQTTSTGS